jgi:hypothetical protein
MSGSWMLAFGGQNRGAQNSEMRRGARSEYEAENRSREAERFMPGGRSGRSLTLTSSCPPLLYPLGLRNSLQERCL